MKRIGSAVWSGDLKSGKGTVSSASGALRETPYSFAARFESGAGTNPEELVAAAHAGCFSMALAAQLTGAGTPPERIATTATLSLEKLDSGWTVTASHLNVSARVPGADRGAVLRAAQDAEKNCPISRLLNAKITMDAEIET